MHTVPALDEWALIDINFITYQGTVQEKAATKRQRSTSASMIDQKRKTVSQSLFLRSNLSSYDGVAHVSICARTFFRESLIWVYGRRAKTRLYEGYNVH